MGKIVSLSEIVYNYYMTSVRKIISYIILITFSCTQTGAFVFAQEEVLHSLSELPSMQEEAIIKEEAPQVVSPEFKQILEEKQQFESIEPLSVIGNALLEERESFIAHSTLSFSPGVLPTMSPQFIINPLLLEDLSRASVIGDFLS